MKYISSTAPEWAVHSPQCFSFLTLLYFSIGFLWILQRILHYSELYISLMIKKYIFVILVTMLYLVAAWFESLRHLVLLYTRKTNHCTAGDLLNAAELVFARITVLTGLHGFTAQFLDPQWLFSGQNGQGLFRFTWDKRRMSEGRSAFCSNCN